MTSVLPARLADHATPLAEPPAEADAFLREAQAHSTAGRLADAERACRQALARDPRSSQALHLLGRITHACGNYQVAAALLGRAISLAPDRSPEAAGVHVSLGDVEVARRRDEAALACYQRAIALQPDLAKAHRRLGGLLLGRYQLEEAVAALRRAAELQPDHPRTYELLAEALRTLGRLDEALAAAQRGVAAAPERANVYLPLAGVQLTLGQVPESIASFRRALALDPGSVEAGSSLLFTLHYDPDVTRETLLAETRVWAARHAAPHAARIQPHTNTRDPDRPLRVGYVSADFINHPVGYFLEAVVAAHDPEQVEVFCLPTNRRTDALGQRLRGAVGPGHWCGVTDLDDDTAAALIRRDQIDILVDLSGHTGGHRLELFARKPAPVQVSWMGYFNTTGVEAIDYILLDRYVCPAGDERLYVEQVVRLPETYLCYAPREAVEVGPLPALERGHLTFGCFNKLAKLNPAVIQVWSAILRRLPEARLVLKNQGLQLPSVRERYLSQFAAHGVAPERIELQETAAHAEYLRAYNGVDLALDPFPFNGGTTTVEGLWMGVPAVTLAGDRFAGRMGVAHLSAVGLSELVAETPEAYVERAVQMAGRLEWLAETRRGLRARLLASPLCDAAGFTRGLEAAYRAMWQRWCQSPTAPPA